jgi:hypothetical protein
MASIMPQGRRGGYDEGRRAGKMDLVAARTADCAKYTAPAALQEPPKPHRRRPGASARACSPRCSTPLERRPTPATSMPRASRTGPPSSCSAIVLAPSSTRSTNDVAEAGDRSVIGACDFRCRGDADDDVGRPRLVGYCARPCFARARLSMLRDSRVAYRVEYAGRRSTHHVVTPIEFLARRAALVAAPSTRS